MNPIVLLAEILAHGITPEWSAGSWNYVGADASASLGSLGDDLDDHHRQLEEYLNGLKGSQNAR
jgi:hypothetical protein